MIRSRDRRIGSPILGIAGVVTIVTAVGYVRLLSEQGELPGLDARQAFVLTLLVGMAMIAAAGTLTSSRAVRAAAAAACSAALLPLGVLALFSIGMFVLIAGALAAAALAVAVAESPKGSSLVPSAVGAIVGLTVIVVGFVAT